MSGVCRRELVGVDFSNIHSIFIRYGFHWLDLEDFQGLNRSIVNVLPGRNEVYCLDGILRKRHGYIRQDVSVYIYFEKMTGQVLPVLSSMVNGWGGGSVRLPPPIVTGIQR